MINTKLIENLSKNEKLTYLAKYLNRYIEDVISKFTNNKELLEQVIENNTLMYLIVKYIDEEEKQVLDIYKYLDMPYNTEFLSTTWNHAELGHILYDLIIKD